jgi:hypothetical protein
MNAAIASPKIVVSGLALDYVNPDTGAAQALARHLEAAERRALGL